MTDRKLVPDCFCPDEDGMQCDWEIEAVVTYRRTGHPDDSMTFKAGYEQQALPQLVAHAMATEIVKAANEVGQSVYLEWLDACVQGGDIKSLAVKVMGGAK